MQHKLVNAENTDRSLESVRKFSQRGIKKCKTIGALSKAIKRLLTKPNGYASIYLSRFLGRVIPGIPTVKCTHLLHTKIPLSLCIIPIPVRCGFWVCFLSAVIAQKVVCFHCCNTVLFLDSKWMCVCIGCGAWFW